MKKLAKTAATIALLVPNIVLAANDPCAVSQTTNISANWIPKFCILTGSETDLITKLGVVFSYALLFIGALAIAFVVYGAVLYLTSGGDSEKVDKAKKTLLYAIIGLVLVITSYIILQFVIGFVRK